MTTLQKNFGELFIYLIYCSHTYEAQQSVDRKLAFLSLSINFQYLSLNVIACKLSFLLKDSNTYTIKCDIIYLATSKHYSNKMYTVAYSNM